MRKALFALPLLVSALIFSPTAHADTISFIVSVIGSGFVGDTAFTDQRVTFAVTEPEQVVADAFAESGGTPSSFGVCFNYGATATVQGLGTFGGPDLPCVFHNLDITNPPSFYIVDGENDLSISVVFPFDSLQSSVGPIASTAYVDFNSCDPGGLTPCPPFFNTDAGELTFTSYEPNTGFGELLVTSPIPEPSTIVLFATGLLGVGRLVRRGRPFNA